MGDGEIAVCRRWTGQLDGGHLASNGQNQVALGICLVGNFDKHPPSSRQMESLRILVEALMARCQLTPRAVKTHQQINIVHTRCPGSKFPIQSLLNSLPSPGR
jgi:N-acetyl-anhydromuramyl-L-alanine amidase AmpD